MHIMEKVENKNPCGRYGSTPLHGAALKGRQNFSIPGWINVSLEHETTKQILTSTVNSN